MHQLLNPLYHFGNRFVQIRSNCASTKQYTRVRGWPIMAPRCRVRRQLWEGLHKVYRTDEQSWGWNSSSAGRSYRQANSHSGKLEIKAQRGTEFARDFIVVLSRGSWPQSQVEILTNVIKAKHNHTSPDRQIPDLLLTHFDSVLRPNARSYCSPVVAAY